MYLPAPLQEERPERLHRLIHETGLATLVTFGTEGPVASHLSLYLDATAGPYGTLYGHLARANGQWRTSTAELDCLAIFTGPDAYVPPAAYAAKAQTGKVVPTWNYVAVHAYGPLRLIEEPERLLTLVTRLTERHEATRPHPWAVSDAPADSVRGHLKGIVGLEVPIARLEGKWKMSQNRTPENRAGGIRELERSGTPDALAVADVMRGLEPAGGS